MSITIRPATRDDLASIKLLEDDLHDYKVNPELQWEHFEENPDRAILLAELEGKVVGMVVLNLVYKLSKVMVFLDELVVSESSRGHGAGTVLMHAAEQWSWEHGADILDFSSRGKHAGTHDFYEKMGYSRREAHLYRKKREGYDGSS